MALLFMDSFDHYATADILEKWSGLSGATIQATAGRRSGPCIRLSGSNSFLSKGLVNTFGTVIMGFAYKVNGTLDPVKIGAIYDSTVGRDLIFLQQNSDGSLSVIRGSTGGGNIPITTTGGQVILGTTAGGLIVNGIQVYIEFKAFLHASAGTIEIRINGVTVLSLTGLNTTNTAIGWTSIYFWCNTTTARDFDDLYICDGSGSPNDFLGDVRVDARRPTGAGTTTGWTPLAGANWDAVNDTAPDDDSTYNSTSTLNAIDTFVVEDAPVVGATLYGIQHNLSMKKTDAGPASVAPVIRHSGTNNAGSNFNPGTGYAYGTQIATEIAPGVPITEANFNAAEFGYKKTV